MWLPPPKLFLLYYSLNWAYFQRFATEANNNYPNILTIIL